MLRGVSVENRLAARLRRVLVSDGVFSPGHFSAHRERPHKSVSIACEPMNFDACLPGVFVSPILERTPVGIPAFPVLLCSSTSGLPFRVSCVSR